MAYQEEEDYAVKGREVVPSKLPLDTQEKHLAVLHEEIGLLADAMRTALIPEHPKDMTRGDTVAPIQSPLAERIDSNNDQIIRASSRVRDLRERLEI